jgi:uncharacterized protein (DUF2141 family)
MAGDISYNYLQIQQSKVTLTVEISNLRSTKGQVGISLYNRKEGFPQQESSIYRKVNIHSWEGEIAEVVIRDLPEGYYAIASWHDENGDDDMNYSFLGIPKEGYCFSNNIKPWLRAPTWEEARFSLYEQGKTIRIMMKY